MGKGFEQTLLQRRYTNGQQVYENMNIASHQENANHPSEISPHMYENMASNKNTENNKCW